MAERSAHITTLFFLGKLEQAVNQYFVHILSLVIDNNPSEMIRWKGGEWPYKLFHDQSPRKYETGPGSNLRPLDLQSDSHLLPDTLPTALRDPAICAPYNPHLKVYTAEKGNELEELEVVSGVYDMCVSKGR